MLNAISRTLKSFFDPPKTHKNWTGIN